jgi:hypothetical protein
MADLEIEVTVRQNAQGQDQTMSQYRMSKNRKLTFINKGAQNLVITPKGSTPFVDVNDPQQTVNTIVVPPNDERTVRIKPSFQPTEFQYSAKIGTAITEDPIVILE